MELNLETVNKMRAAQGLEPLTELPGAGGAVTETPEEIEAKRLLAEKGGAVETPEQLEAKRKAAEEKAKENPELSDEQLLKLLNGRGIKVDSLETLKAPIEQVDPVKLAEKRDADELAFGLTKGLFNKKEYEQFVADTQDPQDFVYAQYHAEAKAEDPELTDDDIQAEFLQKYGLNLAAESRQYKRGVKEINTLANVLLKEKYGKIYDAKGAFSAHEESAKTTSDRQKKIADAAPAYKKDLDEVFAEMKKIPFKFGDTDTYEVDTVEASLNEIKSYMQEDKYALPKIEGGYSKEALKAEAFATFLYKNFPTIAQEVANQHLKKHMAGVRGIPLLGGSSQKQETVELTESQKKMVEMYKQQKEKETAN